LKVGALMSKLIPFVFAVSAVSGGGKTTIVKQLNNRLRKSKALYFDDYDFDDSPVDINDWVENGADHNQWNLKPLIHDLKSLIFDENLSLEYIILDYPFAYRHHSMNDLLNFTIFIDTPLDVALGRRIQRDYKNSEIEIIQNDITNYLNRGRSAYLDMLSTVKPNSDYIVDGLLPIETIIELIVQEITKQSA
jgi:uridine kinase